LRDSLPIDMLLSALCFLVVAQSSSEVPEGLMNNPVYVIFLHFVVELRKFAIRLASFVTVSHNVYYRPNGRGVLR